MELTLCLEQALGHKTHGQNLEAAVARVADGSHVAFGGCLFSRTPLASIRALLRRRPRRLTISRNLMCYEGEWCMVAGAVENLKDTTHHLVAALNWLIGIRIRADGNYLWLVASRR